MSKSPIDTKPKTEFSDEIKALMALVKALDPLDDAARQRAIKYLCERFGVYLP
jgi:hypothetical protein